jgi:hypothetical protein
MGLSKSSSPAPSLVPLAGGDAYGDFFLSFFSQRRQSYRSQFVTHLLCVLCVVCVLRVVLFVLRAVLFVCCVL